MIRHFRLKKFFHLDNISCTKISFANSTEVKNCDEKVNMDLLECITFNRKADWILVVKIKC